MYNFYKERRNYTSESFAVRLTIIISSELKLTSHAQKSSSPIIFFPLQSYTKKNGWCGRLKWRTKWLIAIVLTLGVIGVAKLEEAGVIQQPVTQYVTSGKDFVELKKWVASIIKDSESDKITVMADPLQEDPFSVYESMQPYKDGVIVSYTNPLPIEAQGGGLVVFTGFTRESGKTITVLYDDGDEVTYGFVGKFTILPYTAVKKGDTLALMEEGAIFLMVKRDGVKLDASLMPTYLSGESQSDGEQ